MRMTIFRPVLLVLLALAAGCGYDVTTPYPDPPPPPQPSVEGLWTASGGPSAILRLAPGQLGQSGEAVPATIITTPSLPRLAVAGLAFDRHGTLWVASHDDNRLIAFSSAALATSGLRVATTVITSNDGALEGPTGLAFDGQGRLWVINRASGNLVRYEPAQLLESGAPAPAVILRRPGFPVTLAFDAAGSLWIADDLEHSIFTFTAAQLAAPGPVSGRRVLGVLNGLNNPAGMAFDGAGNLWIANVGGDNVVAFTPDQLVAPQPREPNVVLTSTNGSLALPVGLAFDANGSLWVVGGGGGLARFDPASLATSGAPEPSVRLRLSGRTVFWSVAFWPRPVGLPIN